MFALWPDGIPSGRKDEVSVLRMGAGMGEQFGMKRKETEPNYEIQFRSTVCALQSAWAEYKKAMIADLRCTGISGDGYFTYLDGYAERRKKIGELWNKVGYLMAEAQRIREKIYDSRGINKDLEKVRLE